MAVNFVQRRLMSSGLKQWAYNQSYFPKYGLWRDDVLQETPEVKEALRRLPNEIIEQRNFRILRAIQLNIEKSILPKAQWTKLEDDILYLRPLLEMVEKEKAERVEWEKNH